MAQVIDKTEQTPQAIAQQGSFMQSMNGAKRSIDPMLFRPTTGFIHVFTVSKLEHNRESIPGIVPKMTIPAVEGEQRYRRVITFPNPLAQIECDPNDPENAQPKVYYHDAKRVAMDFCNPANVTLNQEHKVQGAAEQWVSVGDGCDLTRQGLFWSENEVPTEKEIVAAEKRLEEYRRALLTRIDAIPDSDPQKQYLVNRDAHAACDQFQEERSWHKPFTVKVDCPNCGARIPKGAGFHALGAGLCVNNWKSAVDAGVKTMAEVPEGQRDKRWWKEAKA